jgi:hypothetical protein
MVLRDGVVMAPSAGVIVARASAAQYEAEYLCDFEPATPPGHTRFDIPPEDDQLNVDSGEGGDIVEMPTIGARIVAVPDECVGTSSTASITYDDWEEPIPL